MTKDLTGSTAVFEASRRRLLSIAYRMLGSFAEAEDVVQETWLRWHEADDLRLITPVAWLTTVTTRLSIDRLRRLQRERATEVAPWLPEPWMDEYAPSAEDTVSLLSELSYGVLLMLERLNPDERAALLLHEVFDCQYDEISRTLDKTPTHCRQLVRRAKERVQSGRARRVAGRQVDEDLCEQTARDFLAAICNQDKQAILQLIAPDAVVMGRENDVSLGVLDTPVASLGRLTSLAVTQTANGFADAAASLDFSGLQIECVGINGGWGAVFVWQGRIALSLSLEIDQSGIRTIYAVGNPRTAGKHYRSDFQSERADSNSHRLQRLAHPVAA